jgi:hypothetical protein
MKSDEQGTYGGKNVSPVEALNPALGHEPEPRRGDDDPDQGDPLQPFAPEQISGTLSTNRLLRNPARVALVLLTPSTKVRLVAARARPTMTPFLTVSLLSCLRRRAQKRPMRRVARENRRKRKSTGGISRKPILLKMKLPPQKKVVNTSQNT